MPPLSDQAIFDFLFFWVTSLLLLPLILVFFEVVFLSAEERLNPADEEALCGIAPLEPRSNLELPCTLALSPSNNKGGDVAGTVVLLPSIPSLEKNMQSYGAAMSMGVSFAASSLASTYSSGHGHSHNQVSFDQYAGDHVSSSPYNIRILEKRSRQLLCPRRRPHICTRHASCTSPRPLHCVAHAGSGCHLPPLSLFLLSCCIRSIAIRRD
jgi:hypothetical protein